MLSGRYIAHDTESTGLSVYHGARPFAFSFCNEEGETLYYEADVNPHTRQPIIKRSLRRELNKILQREDQVKVFHNAKHDIRQLKSIGVEVHGPGGPILSGGHYEDTLFLAHSVDPSRPTQALKPLAGSYGLYDDSDESQLKEAVRRLRNLVRRKAFVAKHGDWALAWQTRTKADGTTERKGIIECDYWLPRAIQRLDKRLVTKREAELCEKYAVLDAVRTMALYMLLIEKAEELDTIDTYNRELALMQYIYRAEKRGVATDLGRVEVETEKHYGEMVQQKKRLRRYAWEGFNSNSHPQKRKLLYETLGLAPRGYTDTGLPSVSAINLEEHWAHPAVDALLRITTAEKALGSFFHRFNALAVDDTLSNGKCIHPNFRQCGPITGRLACADPNLQNLADEKKGRGHVAFTARSPMGPRPGWLWGLFDYKSLELCIFGWRSGEPTILSSIREGKDFFSVVANSIWGGSNNEDALDAAAHVVGLDGMLTGKAQHKLQRRYGVKDIRKLSKRNRQEIARDALLAHNWDIVSLEKTAGLETKRQNAKTVMYAIIYGGMVGAVRKALQCSDAKAYVYLDRLWKAHPRIQEFLNEVTDDAMLRGGVRTAYGRWIPVPADRPYVAVNYTIQGDAADLIKEAIRRTCAWLEEERLPAHLVVTVHDENIYEIADTPLGRRYGLWRGIRDRMVAAAYPFDVPIKVEVERCRVRWSEREAVVL